MSKIIEATTLWSTLKTCMGGCPITLGITLQHDICMDINKASTSMKVNLIIAASNTTYTWIFGSL